MANMRRAVVVLAAGLGKRMQSRLPKVLHPVLGEPMLAHVLRTARALDAGRVVVVTGHGREAVEAWVAQHGAVSGDPVPPTCIEQRDPNGTGHAVQCALPAIGDVDEVLVLYGDVPLLTVGTLERLLAARGDGPLSLLVTEVADPTGYGRVLLNEQGRIARVVEHKDATATERLVRVVNAGMMAVRADFLRSALQKLRPDNAQGELYLTDLLGFSAAQGEPAAACFAAEAEEVQGVNNRAELAQATAWLRQRVARDWMLAGVALEDSATTWIEASVVLEPDCTIGAGVELRGATQVAAGAHIERGCVLRDTQVGPGAHVLPYVVSTEASIGPSASVGPFAHLRPGTVLHDKVKVGNFVETKKAVLRKGAKASHLSYLGDADIGEGCNIGAGTITCNYDGVNKFKTVLGKEVFIGSDTQLVAPVTLGDGAYVGAGSTITRDVPAGALALSRTAQTHIEGWTDRKKARDAARKAQAAGK
ncbi:MAG: bifunctional UDP-N-acetylglucosamine diphosphorylase/glucosamine-1-phosphate N-acetyltransferase GlmU [Myxococcota bacterium]